MNVKIEYYPNEEALAEGLKEAIEEIALDNEKEVPIIELILFDI